MFMFPFGEMYKVQSTVLQFGELEDGSFKSRPLQFIFIILIKMKQL